jgi:CheY-like chemotaxis protein
MRVCKVLVVDDFEVEALTIAERLRELGNSPTLRTMDIQIQIEVSTSAAWAWDQLDNDPERWQLIFSDIFMPEEHPGSRTISKEDRGFLIWARKGAKGSPGFEHGGFGMLAENLAAWRKSHPELTLPKLVLLSSHLSRQNRRTVNGFARQNRSWIQYFDKDECPEHWGHDKRYLYRYALLQALAKSQEKSWADGLFQPETAEWRALRLEAERYAQDSRVRHVLVLGPSGSGKSVLSRFLLESRGIENPPTLIASELDDRGIEPHWRSEGLYVSQLERINPRAHDPIYRELEMNTANPENEKRLCVWSALSMSHLQECKALSDSFLSLLRVNSLEIGKLLSEDVPEHAAGILGRIAPDFAIDDETYSELAKAEWSDNLRGLYNALSKAVSCARDFGESEIRIEHLYLPSPKVRRGSQAMGVSGADRTPSASLQQDTAAGMSLSVPNIDEEIKEIRTELKRLRNLYREKPRDQEIRKVSYVKQSTKLFPTLAKIEDEYLELALTALDKPYPRILDEAVKLFTRGTVSRREDLDTSKTRRMTRTRTPWIALPGRGRYSQDR